MFNHLVTQQTVHPDVIQMNETQPLYFLRFSIRLQHYSRRSTVASVSSTFPHKICQQNQLYCCCIYTCIYFFPLEDNCMNSILSPLLCKWSLCYSRIFPSPHTTLLFLIQTGQKKLLQLFKLRVCLVYALENMVYI